MKAKINSNVIQSLVPTAKRYDVRDTELKGFLVRVPPNGDPVNYCDYRRPDGRRTKVRLGSTTVLSPQQARDEAKKVLGDRAKGQDPAATRKIAKQETLEAFIEKHYRPWAEAHRKTGKQIVSCTLARFTEFKGSRLSDISNWKVEQWRAARRKAGIKAATVNRNVTMLKAILQKAVEWGVIEQDPLAKVKPLKTDSAARIRYLEPDEEAGLRKVLNTHQAPRTLRTGIFWARDPHPDNPVIPVINRVSELLHRCGRNKNRLPGRLPQ